MQSSAAIDVLNIDAERTESTCWQRTGGIPDKNRIMGEDKRSINQASLFQMGCQQRVQRVLELCDEIEDVESSPWIKGAS